VGSVLTERSRQSRPPAKIVVQAIQARLIMDAHISDERLAQLITLTAGGDAFYDILAALGELQDRRRKEQQEPPWKT
jgi:hypothetical protein